jgi:hypothetical protein
VIFFDFFGVLVNTIAAHVLSSIFIISLVDTRRVGVFGE